MPRLFTGIELPEAVRDAIGDLEAPIPGARWIEMDDLHLTLRFAGDVTPRIADELVGFLADIEIEPFEIQVKGLDTFGGKDPRTLYAGIVAGEGLERLHRANERAARAAGLPPEGRKFTPHVTIARLSNPRIEALARFLQHNGRFATAPFMVERFVLYGAKPGTGGGPYTIEQAFPIGRYHAGLDWQDEDEPRR